MQKSEITKIVVATIRKKFKIKQNITPGMMITSLNIDSLDLMMLIIKMEEQWKLAIPDDQLTKIKTIQDLVDGIDQAIKKKNHGTK